MYDYAIIGAGAAGLHLAILMAEDPFFAQKKVLILDPVQKSTNDRTWSFWEKGTSRWDDITYKQWKQAQFISKHQSFELQLGDYLYKTIKSADFYQYAKKIILASDRFDWVQTTAHCIDNGKIVCDQKIFEAKHIFDSRLPKTFEQNAQHHPSLIQHFMGWFIRVDRPLFDDSTCVFMDYRLQWNDETSFTYVLPFSPTEALVEFTLFNNSLLQKETYEEKLKTYISTYLKIDHYSIQETEKGSIPMSSYPFYQHHKPQLTKIGTAGGWVRPSSGYMFKNAERYSRQIITNIKSNRHPHHRVAHNRFRKYDRLFLKVLQNHNHLGPEIFSILYQQPADRLFRFLDEESTRAEEYKVMFSLNKPVFRKALF